MVMTAYGVLNVLSIPSVVTNFSSVLYTCFSYNSLCQAVKVFLNRHFILTIILYHTVLFEKHVMVST
jgi:hypothetical protein